MCSKVMTFNLMVLFIVSIIPIISSRTMSVRPLDSVSVYEQVNQKGASIAKLVGHVSNKITSEFLVSSLTSSGHSDLLCNQEEMDIVVKDYQNCVRQVQHHLVCGVHGEVCDWVLALVDSCTNIVLGQCITREMVDLLMKRQTEAMLQNRVMQDQNCEDHTGDDKINVVLKRIPRGDILERRQILASTMLRLG